MSSSLPYKSKEMRESENVHGYKWEDVLDLVLKWAIQSQVDSSEHMHPHLALGAIGHMVGKLRFL